MELPRTELEIMSSFVVNDKEKIPRVVRDVRLCDGHRFGSVVGNYYGRLFRPLQMTRGNLCRRAVPRFPARLAPSLDTSEPLPRSRRCACIRTLRANNKPMTLNGGDLLASNNNNNNSDSNKNGNNNVNV